jgi:hypothetical protein
MFQQLICFGKIKLIDDRRLKAERIYVYLVRCRADRCLFALVFHF